MDGYIDGFMDLAEVPFDTREFSMPNLGKCHIRVKPYEDSKKEPLAYVIKDDEEVCAISILHPRIYNGSLSLDDRSALIEFLNTEKGFEIAGMRPTEFDGIWHMWISKNVNDGPMDIPENVPDYTQLP